MRRIVNFIIVIVVTVAILAGFYFFFPHVWGELLYPLDYKDTIKKYSEERGLRPNFVAAMIYTESRFNAGSVSGAGATGLMQIMPGTGQSISQELGESSMGNLRDPDTSIRYGTWYIKGLVDKYNGDTDLALAAYNAGSGRADKFKDNVMPLPYETVFYVQKVKGTEEMYDKVYDSWYSQSISEKKNPVAIGFSNISDYVKKLILGNK
ncbi:MAG: Lytic transglycosylase catalytic [Berkelbacteria bacterium GW2011_GWA1_36_9]|uniref:Lytic transglycosylase catalytic n=1 Tax=Berkelbacteria bacterium GW2011_GWA1_36_9 TaxID=1618331 RepID=A0A0G0IPV7_9BACT|nr:MAG: Lytic transglycosylase catalytic [Berkelbacteria bacterium GW2011_GWA1_36_9]